MSEQKPTNESMRAFVRAINQEFGKDRSVTIQKKNKKPTLRDKVRNMLSPLKVKDKSCCEETEKLDELKKSTLANYIAYSAVDRGQQGIVAGSSSGDKQETAKNRMTKRLGGIALAARKLAREETEKLDELKSDTLASYIKKASHEVGHKSASSRQFKIDADNARKNDDFVKARKREELSNKAFDKSWGRRKGIARAANKLANRANAKTVVEQEVNEISDKTLASYVNKARVSADELAAQGKYKKSTNRRMDVLRALGKRIDKTSSNIRSSLKNEEAEQIDELKSNTLARYAAKAHSEILNRKVGLMYKDNPDNERKIANREAGKARVGAIAKIRKAASEKEYQERLKNPPKYSSKTSDVAKSYGKYDLYGLGKDPISGRSYNEEIEQLIEMPGANMDARAVRAHLRKKGWALARTSGGHDVYSHESATYRIAVPRHNKLKAPLVRSILKQSEIKEQAVRMSKAEHDSRPETESGSDDITSPEKKKTISRDQLSTIATAAKKKMAENASYLEERLSKNDPPSQWIQDFVNSDNPKFAGKSKQERINMALGAYYKKKKG